MFHGYFAQVDGDRASNQNSNSQEEKYFIEQIKTIIPASAYERIFILATYTNLASENIRNFAASVGLPTENIFNFDNFALTKEGHFDFTNIDLQSTEDDQDFGDPFAPVGEKDSEAEKKVEYARKVRETWLQSHKEYNKLLMRAKALGRHSTDEMAQICKIKKAATQKIFAAYRKVESIEECEKNLRAASNELQIAIDAYDNAKLRNDNTANELAFAKAEKQAANALETYECYTIREKVNSDVHHTTCDNCGFTCHPNCKLESKSGFKHLECCTCMEDGRCTACPNKCLYTWHTHKNSIWKTITKQRNLESVVNRQTNANDNFDRLTSQLSDKANDLSAKTKTKDTKGDLLTKFEQRSDILRNEKDTLQQEIVSSYIELGQVSISSINFHIGEYYDIKIGNEEDGETKAKLQRDRSFYLEQIDLYQQKTQLIAILVNNLGLIMQDNVAMRNPPIKLNINKIADDEYSAWADFIIAKERNKLISFAGKNERVTKAFNTMDDLKLKGLTIFALKKILEG